ncbi:MAG: glycosyltransferase family 4 protein, partial [Thermoanaerobaculia bacterium]|nr:glycosyltransferase family 4 protein [Thermoanaerobaculia bacterium]
MRVLLVANTLPPTDISGVGEQVLQLAGGLERAGHEVRVLGRRAHGIGAIKLLFPLTVLPRFVGELRRFRPDVVQVHESDGALAALLARTLAPAGGSPLLVSLLQVSYVEEMRAVRPLRVDGRVVGRPGWREWVFKWVKAPIQVLLGRLSVDLADLVLAPSRRTADELERDYGAEGVAVLPNVLGGREVAPVEDPSVDGAEGFLLYVGRLRVRKGLEVLFDSLRRLDEEAPRTLIVGDGEHADRLLRAAAAAGVSSRVEFLGRRSSGEVRYLMGRAGGLVVPSIYEGMPLVVLEAMESSLPVIACAVSGIPEVVEEGETGWLVPPEDAEALAAAIAA